MLAHVPTDLTMQLAQARLQPEKHMEGPALGLGLCLAHWFLSKAFLTTHYLFVLALEVQE